MKGPLDDEIEGMARQAQREKRLAGRGVAFQELVVMHLLKHYNLLREVKQIRALCKDQTGEDHLLFSWFMVLHPDFPVWMGAVKHTLKTTTRYQERFRLPAKGLELPPVARTWMFRCLEESRQNAPSHWGGPVAQVFRQYHQGRPLKVIHTADLPLLGWREQVRIPTDEGGETVTVEDFSTFLTALRWSP